MSKQVKVLHCLVAKDEYHCMKCQDGIYQFRFNVAECDIVYIVLQCVVIQIAGYVVNICSSCPRQKIPIMRFLL